MSYVLVAIIAWSIFSVSTLIDKYLLNKPIGDAKVYTFYTGIFAVFAVLLFLPFARWPGLNHFLLDVASGAIFLVSLFFLFRALRQQDVSQIIPLLGALIPIFSLLIEHFWLGARLRSTEYFGFCFLVLGTFLITYERNFSARKLFFPIMAALLAAIYYVAVKTAYTPFLDNFAFTRLGSLIAGVFMLVHPQVRAAVFHTTRFIKKSASGLFITKSVLSGLGFVVLNYAISIGDPAIINSLQGIEYALIFIMVLLLSTYRPDILREDLPRPVLWRKVTAIMLIFIGLAFLY